MAERPVFIPILKDKEVGVLNKLVYFEWHSGLSPTQKRKSIRSLHDSASSAGFNQLLEISTKSESKDGVRLSAFNLSFSRKEKNSTEKIPLESAFQGSKVFEAGGPFIDLYDATARDAKRDPRLRSSGKLLGFRFLDRDFKLEPVTNFYDWLYVQCLLENHSLAETVLDYSGFTDIEFNPKKSFNCQAHSAALYASCKNAGLADSVLSCPDLFRKFAYEGVGDGKQYEQGQLQLI